MKAHLLLITALGTSLIAGASSAALLASYDIEADGSNADLAGAVGLTASSLDASAADGVSGNAEWVGANVPYFFHTGLNDSATPTTSDIVATWSLTPDAGKAISIGTDDALEFGLLAYLGASSGDGLYAVYGKVFIASDSEFTTILAQSEILSDSVASATEITNNAGGNETVGTVNLDNAVLSASTLFFGFAMTETGDSAVLTTEGSNGRYDGIKVNGEVVPEPGSLALLGLGGLCLLKRRRRA